MLCKKPYMKGVIACGCGQCVPCRINKKRLWSHRILLESRNSDMNTFVTLTLRDEELIDASDIPWDGNRPLVGNLVPSDPQKWLKKLRSVVPEELRYFLVGEYGDATQRPHYHVALFGFPNCVYGRTRPKSKPCCGPCEIIQKTWGKGNIYLGELNKDSAQYIAGYVTKKWTKEDVWTKQKLKGRHPEFARMSLKPGIGATVIKKLINFTVPTRSWDAVRKCLDAPVILRNSGSTLPLGRYLRRKWREGLGRSPDTPKPVLEQYLKEMQILYGQFKEKELLEGTPKCFISPESAYRQQNFQKIINLEAKAKIKYKEKSL